MKKNFDISVIIPTKNRKSMLEEAIKSVLEQKNVSVEIIIVDDNSNDDTAQYVKKLMEENSNIKYIFNDKCLFAHESRKRGFINSTGKYIIFMDDDDFYIDDTFFYKAIEILEKDSSISVTIGATVDYKDNEKKSKIDLKASGKISKDEYVNLFNIYYPKPQSTISAVFRKENLIKADLQNSKMINDTCIYLYGILGGNVYIINEAVAIYRIHSNNISKKTFNTKFVINCLDEKKKIYIKALNQKILTNPTKWYYYQLSQSVYYFVSSSKWNFKLIMQILVWIIANGKGTQSIFIKQALLYILKKKGKK